MIFNVLKSYVKVKIMQKSTILRQLDQQNE